MNKGTDLTECLIIVRISSHFHSSRPQPLISILSKKIDDIKHYNSFFSSHSPNAWIQASNSSSREAAFPNVKEPMTTCPTWPHWDIQHTAIRHSTPSRLCLLLSRPKCSQCTTKENWCLWASLQKQTTVNNEQTYAIKPYITFNEWSKDFLLMIVLFLWEFPMLSIFHLSQEHRLHNFISQITIHADGMTSLWLDVHYLIRAQITRGCLKTLIIIICVCSHLKCN